MEGIQIPISGDLAPLLQATSELKAAMRQLSGSIRAAMQPAAAAGREVASSMRNAATGATASKTSFTGFVGAVSNAGMVIANVAAGAKGIRSAFRFVSGLSPQWKAVAKAAMAAGAAVLGVVVAVKVVRAAISGLVGVASRVWGSIRSGAASTANAVKGIFSGIAGGMGGGMLGPLAGIAGLVGAIALLKSQVGGGLGLAGEIEQTTLALMTLTGSAPEAARVMDSMRAAWLRTGVTIEEQGGNIRKFLALGFSPDDAMKLQKNILDVAGAVGLTSDQATLLGSALAQVKAKGIVSMEELRQQIAEKGIPVFEALAAKMGVSQAALMKLVEGGKVPAQTLLDIFLNMEGTFGKFAGGADRMGMTFLGLVSRMRGAWALLRNDFIAPIADALKPVLNAAIAKIQSFKEAAMAAGKTVADFLLSAFALIRSGRTVDALKSGLAVAIAFATDMFMRGMRGAVAFLATALPPVFSSLTSALKDPKFWQGIGLIFEGIGHKLTAALGAATGLMDQEKVDIYSNAAGSAMQLGQKFIAKSGNGDDFGAVLSGAMFDASMAAAAEMKGPMSAGFRLALKDWQELSNHVARDVAEMRRQSAIPALSPGAPGAPAAEQGAASIAAKIGQAMTLTTSLGRVGGGGIGMTFLPMVTEAKKTNSLLAKIEQHTRGFAKPPVTA